jgi:hypothetical protein
MKEAETTRELAQRQAEEAEWLVQSIQNPQAEVPQANSAHRVIDNIIMQDAKLRQREESPSDDDWEMTHSILIQDTKLRQGDSPCDNDWEVPPPMKFVRP